MEQASIMAGARRLATSSTALLGILAIIGVIVMNVTGRVDSERALDFVKWIVVAYFTKVAVEDGAEKLGAGKRAAESATEPAAEPEAEAQEEKDSEEKED